MNLASSLFSAEITELLYLVIVQPYVCYDPVQVQVQAPKLRNVRIFEISL